MTKVQSKSTSACMIQKEWVVNLLSQFKLAFKILFQQCCQVIQQNLQVLLRLKFRLWTKLQLSSPNRIQPNQFKTQSKLRGSRKRNNLPTKQSRLWMHRSTASQPGTAGKFFSKVSIPKQRVKQNLQWLIKSNQRWAFNQFPTSE